MYYRSWSWSLWAWRGVHHFLQQLKNQGGQCQGFWEAKIEALVLESGKPVDSGVLEI